MSSNISHKNIHIKKSMWSQLYNFSHDDNKNHKMTIKMKENIYNWNGSKINFRASWLIAEIENRCFVSFIVLTWKVNVSELMKLETELFTYCVIVWH
jgi:hypothetical protein